MDISKKHKHVSCVSSHLLFFFLQPKFVLEFDTNSSESVFFICSVPCRMWICCVEETDFKHLILVIIPHSDAALLFLFREQYLSRLLCQNNLLQHYCVNNQSSKPCSPSHREIFHIKPSIGICNLVLKHIEKAPLHLSQF